MKIKIILILKKANTTTTITTAVFKCYKKAGKLNVPKTK